MSTFLILTNEGEQLASFEAQDHLQAVIRLTVEDCVKSSLQSPTRTVVVVNTKTDIEKRFLVSPIVNLGITDLSEAGILSCDNIDDDSCGCGYGGPGVHELGVGSCCRKWATGSLIPTNFRKEKDTWYCTVNGYSITTYTLTGQRLYSLHPKSGRWSLPKDESSVNSLYTEREFS